MYFALANGLSELSYEEQGDLVDIERKILDKYISQQKAHEKDPDKSKYPSYAEIAKMTHDVTVKSQGLRGDIKSEDDLVKVFRDAAAASKDNKGKPMVAILKMKQEVWWNKDKYKNKEHGIAVVYDQKTDTLFYIDPFTGDKSTNLKALIVNPQRDKAQDVKFSIGANNGVWFFNVEQAPLVPGVKSFNNILDEE